MAQQVTTIKVPFILNVYVNCYLIKTDNGYVLIDTGTSTKRQIIERELENAGCHSGNLKLVILSHGDKDHCGNAAYIRDKFATKIAMHHEDTGMVEYGDMSWNRRPPNPIMRLFKSILGLGKSDRFKPDLELEDGCDLSEYGLHANVIHIPGHSRGSIGVLTDDGILFCGDLLANTKKPDFWSIIDNFSEAKASAD